MVDELPRLGARIVDLRPVCLPQGKGLVLRREGGGEREMGDNHTIIIIIVAFLYTQEGEELMVGFITNV